MTTPGTYTGKDGREYRWTKQGEYYVHWQGGYLMNIASADWPAAKAALDALVRCEDMHSPFYTHDCDKCIFLGGYMNGSDRLDLYYCEQGTMPETVIARWGDDGPEYQSGMRFADGAVPALTEARHRAILNGLLVEAEQEEWVEIPQVVSEWSPRRFSGERGQRQVNGAWVDLDETDPVLVGYRKGREVALEEGCGNCPIELAAQELVEAVGDASVWHSNCSTTPSELADLTYRVGTEKWKRIEAAAKALEEKL